MLTVTARLAEGIAAGTVITNTATLAALGDTTPENNQAQAAVVTLSAGSGNKIEIYLPAVIR